MSIDFHFVKIGDKLSAETLRDNLSGKYEILKCVVGEDGVVAYFAVNPLDKELVVYEEGYEFHLQDDGKYWHPINTREDEEFEKENEVIGNICDRLGFELDLEKMG